MTPRTRRRLILLLAGLALLAALLVPLPSTWRSGWRSKLCDLGHVPLFALATLGMWWARGGTWLLPVATGVLVAGGAEIVQGHVGRHADWGDFLYGIIGVLCAVIAVELARGPRTPRRLVAYALLGGVLLLWPLLDAGPVFLYSW